MGQCTKNIVWSLIVTCGDITSHCNFNQSHSPNVDSVVTIVVDVTSLGETVELVTVGLVGPLKIDHIYLTKNICKSEYILTHRQSRFLSSPH